MGEPFVNDNVLVVGATGSGKTTGIVEPRLCAVSHSSIVVPVCKDGLYEKYAPILREKGYIVRHLNFKNPQKSPCGYNPLEGKRADYDILSLARAMVGEKSKSILGDLDSYWSDCASSGIAALLMLCKDGGFAELALMVKKIKV